MADSKVYLIIWNIQVRLNKGKKQMKSAFLQMLLSYLLKTEVKLSVGTF